MSSDSTDFDFDETELSGENGEIYLFQWLSTVEKQCTSAAPAFIRERQSSLEKILVKVITAPDSYPSPGRALRNLAARCMIVLYTRGESRTLFDSLQSLLKVVGDFKTTDKDSNKIAAFSCIGDLMANFGAQFMSFMAEISTIALRTAKSSSSPLLRYHALVALRKSLLTAKRAVIEATNRDILKQMKSGLSDKALPVQRAAADVLLTMHDPPEGNLTITEIESIVSLCSKNLDTADQLTRHAFSRLVGHLLASTQLERPSASESPNKGKQDPGGHDESLPPQVMLTLDEMFTQLSAQFHKLHLSRRSRVGIFDFYAALLMKLGSAFVESNYTLIVGHLVTDIVSNPRSAITRHEKLLVRKLVEILLRDLIGIRMLSEQGQIAAIQELSRCYLKRWPAMLPGQVSPTPSVLTIILRETAGLLQQLGNAPPPVQDALAEPLITLLAHQNHTVRVNAARALQYFCFSTPLRLPKTIFIVMEMLQRDLNSLLVPTSSSDVRLRALGHAYGLAALVCVIPERPLYVSYDASAKVLDIAVQLLKRAGDHDVSIAKVEIEVAWVSIASLMSLGPNFVRPHLPQLLVLWRNALPKSTSKDSASNAGRTVGEWVFLLHVRECALGAILCFLRHNASVLVTLDVARRIGSVLNNAHVFANNLNGQIADEITEASSSTPSGDLSLRAREALLRRRVYQCFTALGFSSITDSMQSTLLQSVVTLFASPDGYTGSSVQAAIASSSGTFVSVWQGADGYAYGLTYIEITDAAGIGSQDETSRRRKDIANCDTISASIDALLRKPVLGACEYDPLSLCEARISQEPQPPEPPPAATSVVDAAIELFAELLPHQDLTSTTRTVTQLLDAIRSYKFEKNSGRKAAVLINASVALVLALRRAGTIHFRRSQDTFGGTPIATTLASFLKDMLVDGDPVLRLAASESMGRLASLAGTSFLTSQIKLLVDQVVNNRDPNGRAGCALAFGAIYSHVGGLAAGPLLKTTINVLLSLSNDPHPVVHFWALKALALVINSASLAYAPFVSSTLGMLLKVYLVESHEREGGTLANANMSGDYPAYPAVCQIIDAVITVLGPDMQESPRTRTLVLNLVHEFSVEDDEAICVEAIKCIQHFLMFAPEHVHIPELVDQFRAHLSSPRRPLKLASINALYQLVQKDALAMSKLGGDQLVEDLFLMLDDDPSVEGVRNVISSWLKQTVIHNPSAWIDLCQRIMSRTTASQRVADAAITHGSLRDDEGESLNLGMARGPIGPGKVRLTSRWRTQLFALQCLHHICTIVAGSGQMEHLDIEVTKRQGIPTFGLLISRVPDLIKMAFTASTAYVTEIRLEGLIVLRDIIEIFATVPDPTYADARLLEQHQAPITAALTPAISPDSTPEILAAAVQTSAIFVGCGVVKDVNRMGRILKLLTGALEQSKESGMLSLGDAGELGPNASAMLRISTLSAWAQLEIASSCQAYLSEVLKPFRPTLVSLWIAYLRDYAIIRANSEFIHDASSVALDASYSSLGKEVLLPYYLDSWPVILQAVATVMQEGDPYVLAAMHGQESVSSGPMITEEPAVFFFIIFGLAYETLAASPLDSTSAMSTHHTTVVAALQAMKCLICPEYSGRAMMDTTTSHEFISLCYRMAMMETATVQVHLVELLSIFAASHDHLRFRESGNASMPLTFAETHCLHICAYLIRHTISSLKSTITDRVNVIRISFGAFCSIASVTPDPVDREDIRGVAMLLYCDLLKNESSDIDLVGPTLLSLKSILELPTSNAEERFGQLINGLLSACLLNIDEMRNRQGLIANQKIKNNLLAAVLILTVINPFVKIGQAIIKHCCFLISQKLYAMGEISLTAAHCAKTLIVTSMSGNILLRQCSKLLVPSLIEYIIKIASQDNGKVSETDLMVMEEVWKAFSAIFVSVMEVQRISLLGILLPTTALLLPLHSPALHLQTVTKLLFFVTFSPSSFREAAAKLDIETREVLEQSVRHAVGDVTREPVTSKPQISLRSF